MIPDTPKYWDSVPRARADTLWRRFSDRANARLLSRWLGTQKSAGLALKTDLFDEAWTDGLIEAIQGHVEAPAVGMDVSLRVAQSAKAHHPSMPTVVADIRALPFRDGCFDLIVSPSTMDHFEEHSQIHLALGELGRIVTPNGVLVATLDNPLNPIVAVRNAAVEFWMRRGAVPYFVGVTLGPSQFKRMAASTGLTLEKACATQHFPRVALVLLEKLGLARGSMGQIWLRLAGAFEVLDWLPTRYITGHFVAAKFHRTSSANADSGLPKSPVARTE